MAHQKGAHFFCSIRKFKERNETEWDEGVAFWLHLYYIETQQ